jgi:predicted transcriptional regulator
LSSEKEMVVSGEKVEEVADALNKTNVKILKATLKEPLYISTLAKRVETSGACISESVRVLEDLKMVSIKYECGERGIRKIVSSNFEKIVIILKDEVVS